jgi:hypothetical protein
MSKREIKNKNGNGKIEQRKRKERINAFNKYVKEYEQKQLNMRIVERSENELVRPRVVVSFSTIPSRLNKLEPLLHALRKQTYKPDVIYLNLPKYSIRENCDYVITPEINEQLKFVHVNHMDRDYGPLTKLIGGLQQEHEPNTIIITLDDDKLYDSHTIEDLVTNSQRFSNDERTRAVGRRGWIMRRPALVWPSFSFLPDAINIKTHINVDVLTGVGGVAYRRSMFDLEIFPNDDILEKCFMVDDIYINGYLAQHSIERILVPSHPNSYMRDEKNSFTEETYTFENPLWDKNKDGENNNRALDLFRQYF